MLKKRDDFAVDAPWRQRGRLNATGSGDSVGAEIAQGLQFFMEHKRVRDTQQRVEIDVQAARIKEMPVRTAFLEEIEKLAL